MKAMTKTVPSSKSSTDLAADLSEAIRPWRDPDISPTERSSFLENTVAPENLRRAFWLLLVYLPVTLVGLILNRVIIHATDLGYLAYVDVTCSATFFLLVLYLRRHALTIGWKRYFLIAFYLYNITLMGAYYFTALPRFGETAYYILGLLMMAVLIRLPPRQFIPLLLVTHAIYCTVLLRLATGDMLISGLVNGTNALILAALASWFLFHREWDTYEKGRVITRRSQQLADANARLNEVTAIAAHDLRSPIASVLSYIDVLQTEQDWSTEPYKSTLQELHGILDGTLHLISRMLHAHDAESQIAPEVIHSVDVIDLIQRSIARLQHSAIAKDIHLELETPDTFQIHTSPEVLEQALDNLISNAVKFSPPHSRIRIAARQNDTTCAISVQDAGPGIPLEEVDKLFTKFHRGRNKPTAGEATSGIGLFIVQQLMASLHGSVDYEPIQPTGSIFRLRLPIKLTGDSK